MRSLGIAAAALLASTAGCAVHAPRSTGMGQVSEVESSELGLQQVEGEVARIDPREGRILIRQEEGEVEIQVPEETPVFLQGGIASLSQITEGNPIRATFAEEGLERVARWVEVPREELPAPVEQAPPAEEGSAEIGH